MAFYFGCGTAGSRCAWFWYVVLFAASATSLVVWSIQNGQCVRSAALCADRYNLTDVQVAPISDGLEFGTGRAVRSFCEDIFGSAAVIPPAGAGSLTGANATVAAINQRLVDDCETCVNQLAFCVVPTMPLLIAGIILAALTFLPCFYCCCCASSPAAAAKYV